MKTNPEVHALMNRVADLKVRDLYFGFLSQLSVEEIRECLNGAQEAILKVDPKMVAFSPAEILSLSMAAAVLKLREKKAARQ